MKTNNSKKSGSALMTVLVVIMTVSICLGTITYNALNRKHVAVKLGDRVRAQSIAEAGVNVAYSMIKTNWGNRSNTTLFPLVASYGGGAYTAYVAMASATTMTVSVTCTASYGIATEAVALDVKNFGSSFPAFNWPSNISQYAVLCGGTFDFGGCGNIVSTNETATLHANGAITVSGSANVGGDVNRLNIESSISILVKNNKTVNGDALAPDVTGGGTVAGTTTEGACPPVAVPQADLTSFYQWALDHGEVHPAGWTPPSVPYTPNGGVIWVEGDTGSIVAGPINGAIIATGDVKLSGTVTINGDTDTGFAVVSRDGDIDNESSGVIKGIVYARSGDFIQTANGTLIGSLVVAGSIKKGGVSDVVVYNADVPEPPGDVDASGGDDVGVGAWKQ